MSERKVVVSDNPQAWGYANQQEMAESVAAVPNYAPIPPTSAPVGAAYNALMEEETKESLVRMVLTGFDKITDLKRQLAEARQGSDENYEQGQRKGWNDCVEATLNIIAYFEDSRDRFEQSERRAAVILAERIRVLVKESK